MLMNCTDSLGFDFEFIVTVKGGKKRDGKNKKIKVPFHHTAGDLGHANLYKIYLAFWKLPR